MADEKKPVRWHECFGNWMDKYNCNGCIEEAECLEAKQKNVDSTMEITPPKKSPGRPPKEKKEDNE